MPCKVRWPCCVVEARSMAASLIARIANGLPGVAIALLAILDALPVAHAQTPPQYQSHQIPFDPSKCPNDPHGMVYFAVGRYVLRQPKENLIYITGGDPAFMASLPKPPKPDEPEGCPGHPIQGAAFDLRRISAMPGEPTNPASALADQLRLILNNGTVPIDMSYTFHGLCDNFRLRDNGIPGLLACGAPFQCSADVAYMTKDYTAPIGGKIAFLCRVGVGCAPKPVFCDGGYRLREHFVINFHFLTKRIPVKDFIAADREIRRRIKEAEVPQFPWRNESSKKTGESQ